MEYISVLFGSRLYPTYLLLLRSFKTSRKAFNNKIVNIKTDALIRYHIKLATLLRYRFVTLLRFYCISKILFAVPFERYGRLSLCVLHHAKLKHSFASSLTRSPRRKTQLLRHSNSLECAYSHPHLPVINYRHIS